MMGSELACGVRVQHRQDVVGAGCRAKEQQQPCAAQISDMRKPVQEDWVFSGDVTQLRNDELTVSERRPQHFHASLVSREGGIASPYHCFRVNSPGCSSQQVATERFESASVPNLRLAQMDFDAGRSPQLTLDQVENEDNSVRAADGVQVVEEGAKRLTLEQLILNSFQRGVLTKKEREYNAGINASPCSPPSPQGTSWTMPCSSCQT